MTNYELFVKGLESMIDISDLEYIVKVLKDRSGTVDAEVSRIVAAKTLEEILRRLQTNKRCPKCGKMLYLSDIEDYDYLCTDCQENYFKCEVD